VYGGCTHRRAMGSTSPGFQRRRSEGGAGLSRAGPGHPPGRDGDGTLRAVRGAWVGAVHRWSERFAVLISVPVAVQCLYALGFQTYDGRVIAHSPFGCFFCGAFVFKMLILTRDDSPKCALPLAGGLCSPA